MNSHELQQRIRAGDRDAFRDLYALCGQGVYRRALEAFHDAATASEIVKQVFLNLHHEIQLTDLPLDIDIQLHTLTETEICTRRVLRGDYAAVDEMRDVPEVGALRTSDTKPSTFPLDNDPKTISIIQEEIPEKTDNIPTLLDQEQSFVSEEQGVSEILSEQEQSPVFKEQDTTQIPAEQEHFSVSEEQDAKQNHVKQEHSTIFEEQDTTQIFTGLEPEPEPVIIERNHTKPIHPAHISEAATSDWDPFSQAEPYRLPLERAQEYMQAEEPEQTIHQKESKKKTVSNRKNRTNMLMTFLLIFFITLFFWLLAGILMDLSVIPTIDFGYSWFNETFFPLFAPKL